MKAKDTITVARMLVENSGGNTQELLEEDEAGAVLLHLIEKAAQSPFFGNYERAKAAYDSLKLDANGYAFHPMIGKYKPTKLVKDGCQVCFRECCTSDNRMFRECENQDKKESNG